MNVYHRARFPIFAIFCAIFLSPITTAWAADKNDTPCDCSETVNNLIAAVEANYLGYHIAIRGQQDAEYLDQVARTRVLAKTTAPENCIHLLHQFIATFRDGHLFVAERPILDEAEAAELAKKAARSDLSETDIRQRLKQQVGKLDPIEGIWYDATGGRYGIVREGPPTSNRFLAVLLTEAEKGWQVGHVKARFKGLSDGSYEVTLYNKQHVPLHPWVYLRGQQGGAALRRDGLMLHIPPLTWGKAYPVSPAEAASLDPTDPRAPTIRQTDGGNVVVTVPSHSPQHRAQLEELVSAFREKILTADVLIVDLRGDEGGSTGTTKVLKPFLASKKNKPARYWVGDQTMVLSSPANLRYFKRGYDQGWIPEELLKRLEANPGKVMPLSEQDSTDETAESDPKPDTEVLAGPRHVAMLIDGAVVSAGEAFLITAMKSDKVTLFGANTGGVIDYQSVSMVAIDSCPRYRILFGYPMFAASDRLPVGGVNATGIPPEVRIGPEKGDPIAFIEKFFSSRKPK